MSKSKEEKTRWPPGSSCRRSTEAYTRINNFWGSLWSIPVQDNSEAPWLEKLRQENCVTAEQKGYEINDGFLIKF